MKKIKRKMLRLWKKQLKKHYEENEEHPICLTCLTLTLNKIKNNKL